MEDKNQTNTNPVVTSGAAPVPEVVPDTPAVATPVIVEQASVPVSVPTPTAEPVVIVEEPPMVPEPTLIADSAPVVPTPTSTRKAMLTQYGIAAGVILVIGAGLLYALEQQGRVDTHIFDSVSQMVTPVPVAAIVNGVKIPLADYEKNKTQLEQAATQNGNDPKNPSIAEQINKQAIDVLVNTELLRQEATKAGLTVTDEQVEARYQEIVTGLQGEDKLQARMAELGMTKETLLKDIKGEILIQSYLSKEVDVTSIKIEEADIKEVYDQANSNPDSPLPPYEQVKTAIEGQLRTTKEQELVNAFIEKIRETAKIETKV